jgi:cytochrome c biogenesis protein CcdA
MTALPTLPVLLPILGAAAGWLVGRGRKRLRLRVVVGGLALAALGAAVAFFVANPYALLDWTSFTDGLNHQTTVADDALGKLGLTEDNGLAYYLWTLTWGLGWVPALASLAGVVLVARDSRRIAAVWSTNRPRSRPRKMFSAAVSCGTSVNSW